MGYFHMENPSNIYDNEKCILKVCGKLLLCDCHRQVMEVQFQIKVIS